MNPKKPSPWASQPEQPAIASVAQEPSRVTPAHKKPSPWEQAYPDSQVEMPAIHDNKVVSVSLTSLEASLILNDIAFSAFDFETVEKQTPKLHELVQALQSLHRQQIAQSEKLFSIESQIPSISEASKEDYYAQLQSKGVLRDDAERSFAKMLKAEKVLQAESPIAPDRALSITCDADAIVSQAKRHPLPAIKESAAILDAAIKQQRGNGLGFMLMG